MQETSESRSVKWLTEFIRRDDELNRLAAYSAKHLSPDPGHDYAHALRVALWGLRIKSTELDARLVIAAALLHDLVNPPKNSPQRKQASTLSARKAADILPEYGFQTSEIGHICDAIRDHSYSRGAQPTEELGKVLQDADRLEALGAVGIMRCVSTGVQMGGRLFEDFDPWAETRELNDKQYAVDHFFTKLFKLPQSMQTKSGQLEAEHRVTVMKQFLEALGDEIGHPWVPSDKTSG